MSLRSFPITVIKVEVTFVVTRRNIFTSDYLSRPIILRPFPLTRAKGCGIHYPYLFLEYSGTLNLNLNLIF